MPNEENLTPEQCHILWGKGTERPFSNPLSAEKREGEYRCAACGLPLFRSTEKFDSGTGWPSFFAAASKNAVKEEEDKTLGMRRTEVLCSCGGHLGHVFEDGPKPTGLRYCINGGALQFMPKEKSDGKSA